MALLYLWKTTKNLSKLQGWLVNILSQSNLFPKINKTIWLPWSLILNLSQVHQSWEKFWAMASILRTCFVKNIVARINSLGPISNRRSNSPSSGPCKVILFHPVVISSMRQEKEKFSKTPKKETPSLQQPYLLAGTNTSSLRRDRLFLNLGEVVEPNLH